MINAAVAAASLPIVVTAPPTLKGGLDARDDGYPFDSDEQLGLYRYT
jgi:hypothetical protein